MLDNCNEIKQEYPQLIQWIMWNTEFYDPVEGLYHPCVPVIWAAIDPVTLQKIILAKVKKIAIWNVYKNTKGYAKP